MTEVEVCYQIEAEAAGGTYISQVRLTRMDEPHPAWVVLDDPTDLTSTAPTCYVSHGGTVRLRGALTLVLKVVFANANESIKLGGIRLGTERPGIR